MEFENKMLKEIRETMRDQEAERHSSYRSIDRMFKPSDLTSLITTNF
jgi:hypothetical protein